MNNIVADDGKKWLGVDALAQALRTNTSLRRLDLSGNKVL
jgi:hypothetical protein